MNIIITKHAKVRMLQREITEEEIESIIKKPDVISDGFKERTVVRKKFPQGILEIIYKKTEDRIIIITCYWIKEA